ncbi:MAG: prepilin-type N-terminal cleavage/methylation domain-containing protein [Candidatus Gastranaerophilaceae bacterium]
MKRVINFGGKLLSSCTAFFRGCKKSKTCYNSDMLHHNHGGIFMKRIYAFTLAEVLITLGIIGIVAALTMPALIADYKKKEDAAKLKKAYTIINQAFKLSEVDNGPSEHWPSAYDIGASAYYEQYWKPYFQGPSLCKTYKEWLYFAHTLENIER